MLQLIFNKFYNIALVVVWGNLLCRLHYEFFNLFLTENIAIKYLCFNNFFQNIYFICIKQNPPINVKYILSNTIIYTIVIYCHHLGGLQIDYNNQYNFVISMVLYTSFKMSLILLTYLSSFEFRKHIFVKHFYYNTFYMIYLFSFASEFTFLLFTIPTLPLHYLLPFILTLVYYTYVFINIQAPSTLHMFFCKKLKFYKNLKKKQF